MVTAIKITEVSAIRSSNAEISGLNVNISIDDVQVDKNTILITYVYDADYQTEVGKLTMKGDLELQEDIKVAAEVLIKWKDSKRLPDDLAEIVLNAINYSCGTNGTLVVRTVNLSPPIIPPRIELAKSGYSTTGQN